MPYTIEDYRRDIEDYERNLAKSNLHVLSIEERLEGLSPEQILQGLSLEQRLAGLPETEVLLELLSKSYKQT